MVRRAVVDLPVDVSAKHAARDAACADGDPANVAVVSKRESDTELEHLVAARTLRLSRLSLLPPLRTIGDERCSTTCSTSAACTTLLVVEFQRQGAMPALAR